MSIRTRGLVRSFDGETAVDKVDLEIAKGEIYGFLGPNGAGKTTTVRMLCTLLAPTAGSAWVAGHDVVAEPQAVRRRIGVALQEAALDPGQTGSDLLGLQARMYGLARSEAIKRIADVVGLVDLEAVLDRPIRTFSGGMKRRLDLAAALIHNPEVLFLDEPTTGLDPISRNLVWDEVRRLNTELGMTVFLTTQYLEEADNLAHRVGILNSGRIVAEGSPAELKRTVGTEVIVARLDRPAEGFGPAVDALPGVGTVEARGDELVITVDDRAAALSSVSVTLNESDVSVRDLTLRTPTLDDVFLELTGNRLQMNHQANPEVLA